MTGSSTRREFLGVAAAAGAALGVSGISRAQMGGGGDVRVPDRLKILVLGGTGQTGPHFIGKALAHGHEVTMFNRGNRSDEMFPEVECLIGDRYPDRGEGLSALESEVKRGRTWDVVLDVWPHIPMLVEATGELLSQATRRYMFVSSVSVYVDSSQKGQDETAEVGSAPDADDTEFTMELFGPFKAECEKRVRRIYGDRCTIYRPGLIVGPRDFSFRGGYWPVRVREGGEVLAPGDGETPTQVIDARDLVAFQLHCMEHGITGTFNVIGPHPHNPFTTKKMLETCRRATGSDAEFTWVPAEFLAEHGVYGWMHMPCWLPTDGEYAGFGSRSVARAVAAGLTFTPYSETVRDTLQWFDELPEDAQAGVRQRAGISGDKESEVLAAWKEHAGEQ